MRPLRRREIGRLLIGLGLFPALSTSEEGQAGGGLPPETYEQAAARMEAVNALRLINTVEVNHHNRFGVFLSLSEIAGSPILECVKPDGPLGPIRRSISLNPGGSFVPGFAADLQLLPDGGGYVVVARQTEDPSGFAFASDGAGVIYEGTSTAPGGAPPSRAEDSLREGFKLINERVERWQHVPGWRQVVRRVGLALMVSQERPNTGFKCYCPPLSNCCSACNPGLCPVCGCNQGCWPCTWCCCNYTTGCPCTTCG
jgi:hypothetical protein